MLAPIGRCLVQGFFHSPLFVVGTGRSGTTVLLQALGHHGQIVSAGREAPIVHHFGDIAYTVGVGERREYYQQCLLVDTEDLLCDLRRICFETAFGRYYGLRAMARHVRRRRLRFLQTRRWCAKTFPSETGCQGLLHLYPSAKLIYIVRNGCSVVESRTRFRAFRDQPFSRHCEVWARSVEHYGYLAELEAAICVRHEDLVAEPEPVFRQIADFVGLEDHAGPVHFAQSTLVHPLDQETQFGAQVQLALGTRPPPYADWTREQRDTFKKACAVAMDKAGYEMPF